MNEERIKEIFSDEAFVKQLFEQEEPEQVQALLAEKEIDLSVEEIIKIQDMLIKHVNGEYDAEELSDEDLEDVSGGFILTSLIVGLAVGTVAAGGVAIAGLVVQGQTARRGRRW